MTSEPTKLKRIVTELLNNACKYTPPAGTITVKVRALASLAEPNAFNRVELVVSNSGSEIPATELTRIFEKFYRIPSSDRTGQGGTGLGLAIVQKLLEQLGGQIRASSQARANNFHTCVPQSRFWRVLRVEIRVRAIQSDRPVAIESCYQKSDNFV